ncbi:MAG TPA: IS200/IS605 family transposase [Bacteroidales bacterium]|nr:IS200/IS605 family transposase [Bacteroidales bacterium]
MAGTFSQIYIHVVFAVSGRRNMISEKWRDEVYKYIAGLIRNKEQKPIIVGGSSDHIHVLIGIRPGILISDLVRDIKNNSSKFINQHRLGLDKFTWQEGYGVFSVSHSFVGRVYEYILSQPEHHKRKSFKEEYLEMLRLNEIKYEDKYLFDFHDLEL